MQGTLYSDVIESGGGTGAATIKSHHNVGGLPEDLEFELVEPLRALFKDEVRAVGAELGLPERLVWRQPFPGPGLAIRIVGGEATKERLDVLRDADAILQDEIRKAGLYRELWQSFCVLPDVRTVGVQGDERTYGYVVVIRAVTSDDAMTADWARLPYDLLETDRLADDQRAARGQPGRARHHVEAARHDRVGIAAPPPPRPGPPGRAGGGGRAPGPPAGRWVPSATPKPSPLAFPTRDGGRPFRAGGGGGEPLWGKEGHGGAGGAGRHPIHPAQGSPLRRPGGVGPTGVRSTLPSASLFPWPQHPLPQARTRHRSPAFAGPKLGEMPTNAAGGADPAPGSSTATTASAPAR